MKLFQWALTALFAVGLYLGLSGVPNDVSEPAAASTPTPVATCASATGENISVCGLTVQAGDNVFSVGICQAASCNGASYGGGTSIVSTCPAAADCWNERKHGVDGRHEGTMR